MHTIAPRCFALVFALGGVACSTARTEPDAGLDASSTDASSVDAGDTALDVAPDAGPVVLPLRGGRLSSTVYGTPSRFSAAAAFWDASGSPSNACSVRSTGSCAVRVCVGPGERVLSAGTITITGSRGVPVTLAPDASGHYPSAYLGMSPPFAPGDAVTYVATGGDIPAFSTTLTLPPRLAVLTPTNTNQVMVMRSVGFTATWTPLTEGTVRLEVTQSFLPGMTGLQGGITAECLVDATGGTGTIPPADLTDFDATMPVTVQVSAMRSSEVMAGGAQVEVLANTGGFVGTGMLQ